LSGFLLLFFSRGIKKSEGWGIFIHNNILPYSRETGIFWTCGNFSREEIPGEGFGVCRPQQQSLPALVSFPL